MWRALVLLLGLQQPPASTARAASEAAVPWTLASNYTGEDFMNHFDFFSGKADPTGGYVNYVDRGTASDASQPGGQLASVLSDGCLEISRRGPLGSTTVVMVVVVTMVAAK